MYDSNVLVGVAERDTGNNIAMSAPGDRTECVAHAPARGPDESDRAGRTRLITSPLNARFNGHVRDPSPTLSSRR